MCPGLRDLLSDATCRQLLVLRWRGKPCLVYVCDCHTSTLQPHHGEDASYGSRGLRESITLHPQPRNRGRKAASCSAEFLHVIWPQTPPPRTGMGLLTSMGMINIIPDSHAQRPISQVSLCAVKLTVSANSLGAPCFRLTSFSFLSPVGLVLPNQGCEIRLGTNQRDTETMFHVKNQHPAIQSWPDGSS